MSTTRLSRAPCLERGLMTGITRVAKESIFPDMNNLKVITTTTEQYEDCFGFTPQEADAVMEESGLLSQVGVVKSRYDGFTFGRKKDICNPWFITNYPDGRKSGTCRVNTGSNALVSELIRRDSREVKMDCEKLLAGESIEKPIDERIVFARLGLNDNALWSFPLISGCLKVLSAENSDSVGEKPPNYTLTLTGGEVRRMFRSMIQGWFTGGGASSAYRSFLRR